MAEQRKDDQPVGLDTLVFAPDSGARGNFPAELLTASQDPNKLWTSSIFDRTTLNNMIIWNAQAKAAIQGYVDPDEITSTLLAGLPAVGGLARKQAVAAYTGQAQNLADKVGHMFKRRRNDIDNQES